MSNYRALDLLSSNYFAQLCSRISLVLIACLPLLIPFRGVSRNIDLQGLILIIAGAFAWLAVLLNYRHKRSGLAKMPITLLIIFIACCLISPVANPHKTYGLLGAPYIRLGALGLLACVGCSLAAARFSAAAFLRCLYLEITGIALVSLPYSALKFHSLARIGGVFAQADVFACFLGCGLLIGLEMVRRYPRYRYFILGNQFLLAGLLLMTQTRAVIIAVVVLSLIWSVRERTSQSMKQLPYYAFGLLVIGLALCHFAPSRLTNAGYASESVQYRLQLQAFALEQTREKPLLGYGPGNLADALDCSKLPGKSLRTTCREGYFFNSSHDIFIDRVLAIGWLGGLSYLLLVCFAIYKGLRGKREIQILAYVVILIGLYYLTNVTSVTLELLLWVLLLRCLTTRSASRV